MPARADIHYRSQGFQRVGGSHPWGLRVAGSVGRPSPIVAWHPSFVSLPPCRQRWCGRQGRSTSSDQPVQRKGSAGHLLVRSRNRLCRAMYHIDGRLQREGVAASPRSPKHGWSRGSRASQLRKTLHTAMASQCGAGYCWAERGRRRYVEAPPPGYFESSHRFLLSSPIGQFEPGCTTVKPLPRSRWRARSP